MKTFLALFTIVLLSSCSIGHNEQVLVTPTDVTELGRVNTPIVTLSPTVTTDPNLISSNSPDNKYTVELKLSESPVKLTIRDNSTRKSTQIPITYRYYNRVFTGGSVGLNWSADNKIVMFVLYKEPSPEKIVEDETCFVAVNVEQAIPVIVNYSSVPRGLYLREDVDMAELQHPGLNDTDDFYFLGTNCYKDALESECEHSYISPSGNWELSPQINGVTITSLKGDSWEYNYPSTAKKFDYLLTFVQGWGEDEQYVLFSPALRYSTSWVYGLFQMNLRNGEVVSLLGNNTIEQPYYVSVSPSSTKIIYVASDGKAFIKDLSNDSETSFNLRLEDNAIIVNFVWSPNETMVVFAKFKYGKDNKFISADYLRLNTASGDLITFLNDEPDYLNVIKITNSEVSFEKGTYSLIDGTPLKQ